MKSGPKIRLPSRPASACIQRKEGPLLGGAALPAEALLRSRELESGQFLSETIDARGEALPAPTLPRGASVDMVDLLADINVGSFTHGGGCDGTAGSTRTMEAHKV